MGMDSSACASASSSGKVGAGTGTAETGAEGAADAAAFIEARNRAWQAKMSAAATTCSQCGPSTFHA